MKHNVFIDFDGTTVNFLKAVCDVYNHIYQDHKDFKFADWTKCEDFKMKDVCPLVDNVNDLFSHKLFFENLEFINVNTLEVLNKLCEVYNVYSCSIGSPINIARKSMFMMEKAPKVKNYIYLVQNSPNCIMNKSIINMSDGIIFDDVVSNLDSSNAGCKCVFGDEFEWNKTNEYPRVYNWTDIENMLL